MLDDMIDWTDLGGIVASAQADGCELERAVVVATHYPETWPTFDHHHEHAGAFCVSIGYHPPDKELRQERVPGCVPVLLEHTLGTFDVHHVEVATLLALAAGGVA